MRSSPVSSIITNKQPNTFIEETKPYYSPISSISFRTNILLADETSSTSTTTTTTTTTESVNDELTLLLEKINVDAVQKIRNEARKEIESTKQWTQIEDQKAKEDDAATTSTSEEELVQEKRLEKTFKKMKIQGWLYPKV